MAKKDLRSEFRHWQTVEVRWGDMDAFGHVNNACYFTYCESARMTYFDAIDLKYERQAKDAHGPAVVTATCNFQRQLHHPATLEVGARTSHLGSKSFTLEYLLIRRGSNEIIADGSSVVVWVDYGAGKAIPIPPDLKERIRNFDGLA